jgi:hypothetical protein
VPPAAGVSEGSLVVVGVALLLLGIGIGAVREVLVVVAQNVAPRPELGVATSGNGFAREMGVLLGTAGVGAWYAARIGDALRGDAPVDGEEWVTLTPGRLAKLPASAADIVRGAYTDALVPILAVFGRFAVLLVFLHPVPLATRLDQSPPS